MRSHHEPTRRRGERGIALAVALFALAALIITAATSLLVGSSGIRATRSYRGATQVHFAAESALSHAVQIINGPGITNFQTNVIDQWGTIWGTTAKNFGPLSGFTYTVTPLPNGNPANNGRLLASATGVEGVKNVVVANVVRSDIPSTAPGAVYLANDNPTNANFQGNTFMIDGNDHNYTGGFGTAPPVPGISTRNATNTQETINSLNGAQTDNVAGYGYSAGPPIVPSVYTSPAAPTLAQVNQIANDIIANGCTPHTGGQINGNLTIGTTLAPTCTYFTANTTIMANGTAQGAGIMIVEGDLTIAGTFDFKGLVIVRGKTAVQYTGDTGVSGDATVYGSVWTNDLNLNVGGTAIVYYSVQALALANQVSGGGSLPSPVIITSLADCAQVPSGSGGCP